MKLTVSDTLFLRKICIIWMASDESGCELPDLEEGDDYGNSSQPPTLPPQGRRDFYSDSSDVEEVEPEFLKPEFLTVAGKNKVSPDTHSGCSELPDLTSAADVTLMEDDGERLSYDLTNDVTTVPIETSTNSLTAAPSDKLYLVRNYSLSHCTVYCKSSYFAI